MQFSAQPFSTTPFSTLITEILVSYNGEFLGFTLNITQESEYMLDIQRDISFTLEVI